MTRAFFALDLPAARKAELGAWQADQGGPFRWARPEGLHLTLTFLGELDEPKVETALRVGAEVSAGHSFFTLQTSGLGAFPTLTRAKVLWMGLEPAPALEALAMGLRRGLRDAGLAFDNKPFKAHLTLGRLDPPGPVKGMATPTPFPWTVEELLLMESLGGCYETRARWPLS